MTFHILVSGLVQGVSYRKFARQKALELGISGTAQNLKNKKVEIYATADIDTLNKYLDALKIGSQMARVDEVIALEVEQIDFKDFVILGD